MASAGSKLTCRRCAGGWSSVCKVNSKWRALLDATALLASIESRIAMGDIGGHHSIVIMPCRWGVTSPGADGRSGWVQRGPGSQPLGCAAGQTSHGRPHWPAGSPQPDDGTCRGAQPPCARLPGVLHQACLAMWQMTSSRLSSLLSTASHAWPECRQLPSSAGRGSSQTTMLHLLEPPT